MGKDDDLRVVIGLGRSYFYDSWPEQSDDEILRMISADIEETALQGIVHWINRRDCLKNVLDKCDDDELDEVLKEFGHVPKDVFGSRKFFSRVYQVVFDAVQRKV